MAEKAESGGKLGGLIAALFVASVLMAAIDFVTKKLGFGSGFVQELAATPFIFVEKIQKALANSLNRPKLAPHPTGIVQFHGYQLPWVYMVIYAGAILAGLMQLGGFTGSFLGAFIGSARDEAILNGITVGLVVALVASFFLGRWIGVRSGEPAWAAVLGMVVFGRLLGAVIDYALVPSAAYQELFGVPKTLGALAAALLNPYAIGFALIIMAVGFVGFWRGRKARLAGYVDHLLQVVSPDTRNVIVELAYDEAQRAGASSSRN